VQNNPYDNLFQPGLMFTGPRDTPPNAAPQTTPRTVAPLLPARPALRLVAETGLHFGHVGEGLVHVAGLFVLKLDVERSSEGFFEGVTMSSRVTGVPPPRSNTPSAASSQ